MRSNLDPIYNRNETTIKQILIKTTFFKNTKSLVSIARKINAKIPIRIKSVSTGKVDAIKYKINLLFRFFKSAIIYIFFLSSVYLYFIFKHTLLYVRKFNMSTKILIKLIIKLIFISFKLK